MILHILVRDVLCKLFHSISFRESRIVSDCGFWTFFLEIKLNLSGVILTNSGILVVICFVEDHCGFPVHSLTVSVTCLLDTAESDVVVSISSCSTVSAQAPSVGVRSRFIRSPVRLRPAKRVLRACLDASLSDILFANNPFDLVVG